MGRIWWLLALAACTKAEPEHTDAPPGDGDTDAAGDTDTDVAPDDSDTEPPDDTDLPDTDVADADHDGVDAGSDCDDDDAGVHPGADEHCDGRDEDCDGTRDEDAVDAGWWYRDADDDGFGDAEATTSACEAPVGYTSDATDCDDAASAVHPGATEVCNGADDDCDDVVDPPGSAGSATWYADADGDGWGDAAVSSLACTAPTGFGSGSGDCDDALASVHPGATESCNGADDDCDGTTDEDDAADAPTWYADADGDGHGDAASSIVACEAPVGYAGAGDDCDDRDGAVSPAASERCDGATDEDCDGLVDEGDAVGAGSYYADADGDGYGDYATITSGCGLPAGSVTNDDDCDDADPLVSPAQDEICWNGHDDDCDGLDSTDDECAPTGTSPSTDGSIGSTLTPLGAAIAFVPYSGSGRDIVLGSSTTNTARVYRATSASLDSTDATVLLTGDAGDGFGAAVAGLADYDGDGYPDVAVGGPTDATAKSGGGAVWIFTLGTASTSLTTSDASAVLAGGDYGGAAGTTLASAGDTDGDGLTDLLVGAPSNGLGGSAAGAVWLVPGGTASTTADDGAFTVFAGEAASDALARAASAGDVDGDGYDDVVLGSAAEDHEASGSGKAYVWLGPFESTRYEVGAAPLRILGVRAGDGVGTDVAGVGDLDADGHADLAVAASGYDDGTVTDAGAVGVWYGPLPTGYLRFDDAGSLLVGDAKSDGAGLVLAGAADIDADGWGDLLVGVPAADPGGVGSGSAVLFYGPLGAGERAFASAEAIFAGSVAAEGRGVAVAAGTDANDDGYDDLLVASTRSGGQVRLWTGGGRAEDVATAPDLASDDDGDGYAEDDGDCDDESASRSPGEAEICGSGTDEDCDGRADRCASAAAVLPSALPAYASYSPSSTYGDFAANGGVVGDLNGDGADDIAVSETWNGDVYVFFGPLAEQSLTHTSADVTISATYGVGFVGPAGDLDGDGYDDLLFNSDVTGVTVFAGGPDLHGSLSETAAGWTFRYGTAGSTVGDVDGDGTDDLLLGGHYLFRGPVARGAYSMYDADLTIDAGGYDLEAETHPIGDVDGDGIDDLLVWSTDWRYALTTASSWYGAAWLFHGPITGASLGVEDADVVLAFDDAGYVGHAAVGDLTGDGYAEIVVASEDDTWHVVELQGLRGHVDPAEVAIATITGDPDLGGSSAIDVDVGDIDRDGYGDFALGWWTNATGAWDGQVVAFRGPLSGPLTFSDADYDVSGSTRYGAGEITSFGDVDADGFDDLVIGMPLVGASTTLGAVGTLYGGWTGTTDGHVSVAPTPGEDRDGDGVAAEDGDCHDGDPAVFPGGTEVCGDAIDDDCDGFALVCASSGAVSLAQPNYLLGSSTYDGQRFAPVGDVDGDGLADVLAYDGGIRLVPGPHPLGKFAAADRAIASYTSGSGAVFEAVTTLADVDGDGFAEIVAPSPSYGDVHVLWSGDGLGDRTGATVNWTFSTTGPSTEFGELVVDAGDMDGDGYADLAVADQGDDAGAYDAGAVFVFSGALPEGSYDQGDATLTIQGDTAYGYVGYTASGLGDMDGDGLDELAFAENVPSSTKTDRGFVWIGDGTTGTVSPDDADLVFDGTGHVTVGGNPVNVGDIDGDGYPDLAVGVSSWDFSLGISGHVVVYSGLPAAGTVDLTLGDWTIDGNGSCLRLGSVMAEDVDLDGDGFADLVLGSSQTCSSSTYGQVAVFYGDRTISGASQSTDADLTITSHSGLPYFGEGLHDAGDVDGDGWSDLWIDARLGAILWHGGPQP